MPYSFTYAFIARLSNSGGTFGYNSAMRSVVMGETVPLLSDKAICVHAAIKLQIHCITMRLSAPSIKKPEVLPYNPPYLM
jgi:hypothetical protein